MKIWELGSDGNRYDCIGLVGNCDAERRETFEYLRTFNGRSLIKEWKPLAVTYLPMRKGEKRKGFANINTIHCSASKPVMDQESIDALHDLLRSSVEILPLDFAEKHFYFINVTDVLDCIDLEKSEYTIFDTGKINRFTKYVFREAQLKDKHIFRMSADYTKVPYVSDEFRQRVIDKNLKGFRFTLIWDSENPEAPANAQVQGITERHNKADDYKNLKKGGIPSIPENELIHAVITWMYGQFNQNSKSLYKVISALPKPCQYIFSMDNLIREIEEGGFNQFFYNFDKRFGKLAEKGFMEIGLKDVSEVVRKANTIFEEIGNNSNEHTDRMEDFMETYKNNPLNELDRLFYDMHSLDKWEDLCIKYIKFCAFAFGD